MLVFGSRRSVQGSGKGKDLRWEQLEPCYFLWNLSCSKSLITANVGLLASGRIWKRYLVWCFSCIASASVCAVSTCRCFLPFCSLNFFYFFGQCSQSKAQFWSSFEAEDVSSHITMSFLITLSILHALKVIFPFVPRILAETFVCESYSFRVQ